MEFDRQLLTASRDGDSEIVRDALARGADIHAKDSRGKTSLFLACTNGHTILGEYLVTQGADVNQAFGKQRQSILHWAAENSAYGVATFLLNHGADVNAQRSDGATPLMVAAKHGNQYVAQLLINRHALLSPRNRQKVTARSIALREGHDGIVGLIDSAATSRPAYLQAAEQAFESKSRDRFLF